MHSAYIAALVCSDNLQQHTYLIFSQRSNSPKPIMPKSLSEGEIHPFEIGQTLHGYFEQNVVPANKNKKAVQNSLDPDQVFNS